MKRRSFLKTVLAGIVLVAAGIRSRLVPAARPAVFSHGIASGDPLRDRVILWTRVSVPHSEPVEVNWQVAADPRMNRVLASGRARTDANRDFTVKIDAGGLPSGRTLYYRFSAAGEQSATGRTRTLPEGDPERIRLAVVSCSNHPAGYFNVYREVAARDDLDAVLHLGDYIYEYGMHGYATERAESLGRMPQPLNELRSLADYRERHAQYKRDPDSQAMLASLPLIAVWDDHELANDSWRSGAEGHASDEGKWAARRDAAIQAYFEWMPIRGKSRGGRTKIFREFRFGNLASLLMLDTRYYGRDPQPNVGNDVSAESIAAALADPRRRMLGFRQERWLRKRLNRAAGTRWQLIGQQVLMSKMTSPDLEPLVDPEKPSVIPKERLLHIIERSKQNPPSVLDTWDGYPRAREDLYADLQRYASNPVVLSGDLHTNLAADLIPENRDTPVSVELMTGAVSSPVMTQVLPEKRSNALRDAVLEQNPWLSFLDGSHRGWLCVTITEERCAGEWHLIDTVTSRDYKCWLAKTLFVRAGEIDQGLQA